MNVHAFSLFCLVLVEMSFGTPFCPILQARQTRPLSQ